MDGKFIAGFFEPCHYSPPHISIKSKRDRAAVAAEWLGRLWRLWQDKISAFVGGLP
jgi:hypothetical protein